VGKRIFKHFVLRLLWIKGIQGSSYIVTASNFLQYLLQIGRAGATGCVLKRSMGRELVTAIESAARGESYFSPTIATKVVEELRARHHGRIVIDAVVPDYYARYPKACVGGWGRRSLNITPAGRVLPCHAAESIPGSAKSPTSGEWHISLVRHPRLGGAPILASGCAVMTLIFAVLGLVIATGLRRFAARPRTAWIRPCLFYTSPSPRDS